MAHLTLNKVASKVIVHLLTQGKKSVLSDQSMCKYRGEGDLKCAVGAMILDQFYTEKMEGMGIWNRSAVLFDVLENSGIDTSDNQIIEFLGRAQNIHDQDDVENWHKLLYKLCHDFDIEWRVEWNLINFDLYK